MAPQRPSDEVAKFLEKFQARDLARAEGYARQMAEQDRLQRHRGEDLDLVGRPLKPGT